MVHARDELEVSTFSHEQQADSQRKFFLSSSTERDLEIVGSYYMRSPVQGKRLAAVYQVHNATIEMAFKGRLGMLDARGGNPAFEGKWCVSGSREWEADSKEDRAMRENHVERLARLQKTHGVPFSGATTSAKVLALWRASNAGHDGVVLKSILSGGYANLATTDAGLFGKGSVLLTWPAVCLRHLLPSPDQESQSRNPALLLNLVSYYSAFPTIAKDAPQLEGRGNHGSYDAHFVPVKNHKTLQDHDFRAVGMNEEPVYSEFVVFDSGQCLPWYVVILQDEDLRMEISNPRAQELIILTKKAMKEEDFDTAFQCLQRISEGILLQEHAEALYLKSQIYRIQNKQEQAREMERKIILMDPKDCCGFHKSLTLNQIQGLNRVSNLPNFEILLVARETILAQIGERFQSENTRLATVTLTGMGGTGKTQIAIHFARMSFELKQYQFVWFFNAQTYIGLVDGYRSLLMEFGISGEEKSDEVMINLVIKKLENCTGWLLVFDNVESQEALVGKLPRTGGHVLITSRHTNWDYQIPVSSFSRAESLQFLAQSANSSDIQKAEKVAELLDDYPLALGHSAAYIKKHGYDRFFKHYNRDFTGKGQQFTTTLEMNLEQAERVASSAVDVVRTMSFISPEDIHFEVLEQVHGSDAVEEAIDALLDYSLVRANCGIYSVHRLVQDVIRSKVQDKAAVISNIQWPYRTSIQVQYSMALQDYQKSLDLLKANNEGGGAESSTVFNGLTGLSEKFRFIESEQ
eukprot:608625-Hanusia_phi.AAC.8